MAVGLWDSSFKNAFHTLSYRFAAVILVILYSRGKGKELKDAEQGCIADTLTHKVAHFLWNLFASPLFFLRWRRVSEEISCLVVESGKCYQRVGGESFLCCCICRKSHIHRELHGAIKENS